MARIPSMVERYSDLWGLDLDHGPLRRGYSAAVIPVRRGPELLVLKLVWRPESMAEEAHALEAWNGNGAVRLIRGDATGGALLLERLDAERTLGVLPIFEAAAVAGELLRRLAIPAPPGFRDLRTVVGSTVTTLAEELGRPHSLIPRAWVQQALELAHQFQRDAGTDLLIHADLHYDNILAGGREPWLAIDPSAMAGEPEAAVAELLWTRLEDVDGPEGVRRLLDALVESAGLDAERAREWAIVRCVDYWLWGLDHGLTEDPIRCRRILEALL